MPLLTRYRATKLDDLLSGNFEINPYSPQAAGLVAAWMPLAFAGSLTLYDKAYGRNGTFRAVGKPDWVADSAFGYALSFDGANDYVQNTNAGLVNAFNGLEGTVAAWLTVPAAAWSDGATRNAIMIRSTTVSTDRIDLYKSSTANRFDWLYRAGAVHKFVQDSAISLTSPMLVALTWSKSADQAKAYLNGVQKGSTLTGLGTWTLALSNFIIGAGDTIPNTVWSGIIGPVQINNIALPPPVIRQMYADPWDLYTVRRRFWAVRAAGWNAAWARNVNTLLGGGVERRA